MQICRYLDGDDVLDSVDGTRTILFSLFFIAKPENANSLIAYNDIAGGGEIVPQCVNSVDGG